MKCQRPGHLGFDEGASQYFPVAASCAQRHAHLPAGVTLETALTLPDDALGVVLFAHGCGSSRHFPAIGM